MNLAQRSLLLAVTLLLAATLSTSALLAQNIVSGDIIGTVTDPSGAVVPNAKVTLESTQTGTTQTTATNQVGSYRFSLLKPDLYAVSVTQQGFQAVRQLAEVFVGQATTLNFRLKLSQVAQRVEVTVATPLIQTENANISTTFSQREISEVPNPGADLTYVAQTAPGVMINVSGGNGNFSAFGLPTVSNVFTVDGMNEMDPSSNLNSSGPTNLLLGLNDIREATVVNNAYSGEYGQLAGSQVNYVSKSGTDSFHGSATYDWNGRTMNANSWFNNENATPRSFVNANQWAASFGGPIAKNKSFFFLDAEGLQVVLPTSQPVFIPSPQFESAVLANLPAVGMEASVPFYQQMFNLWNNAPGANRAVPVTLKDDPSGLLGCEDFAGPPGSGFGTTVPCVLKFQSTASNFTHEWTMVGRIDQILGAHDNASIRIRVDRGVQAFYTDPINPVFNVFSSQPTNEGQLNWRRVLGPNTVNQFIASGSWYSAVFTPKNLQTSLSAFPTTIFFDFFTPVGGFDFGVPSGRRVTQYQFVDDLALSKGAHTMKFGLNFRRSDITSLLLGNLTSGLAGEVGLNDFANGIGDFYTQSFPQVTSQPIALYGLGLYAQDEWRVASNLRLMLAMRVDHNSNPVCQTNCFARLTRPFELISHDVSVPYNAIIATGLHTAYPGTDKWGWQPRFGFAWTPFGSASSTVIRGGFGIFIDSFPAGLVDRYSDNTPAANFFTDQNFSDPLSPAESGSVFQVVAQSNTAFRSQFSSGGTLASITAAVPIFTPPDYSTAEDKFRTPRYQEWNLEVQRALGTSMSVSLNYVGNHGIFIPVFNSGLNAYCPASRCTAGFTGLPASPPDPRFGTITELHSSGVSNYNGLTVSFQRRFSAGFLARVNYTLSHALDTISNGGIFFSGPNVGQEDPFNLKLYNYGNADYDARHYFSTSFVWEPGIQRLVRDSPLLRQALGGWVFSGTAFARSGLPYTVVDSKATSRLMNYGSLLFAQFLGGPTGDCSNPSKPCLRLSQFNGPISNPSGFATQRRNQFRGPGFFDSDFSVMKNFKINERMRFGVGANFYNVFNHPNFANPVRDVNNPSFGTIRSTVSPPTSVLGALGADASPRIIQLQARIAF